MSHRVTKSLAFLFLCACGGGGSGGDGKSEWVDQDDPAWCRGKEVGTTVDRGCGCTSDCSEGERCLAEQESGYPGGTCVHSCDPPCPPDTTCTNLDLPDAELQGCVQVCVSTAECRPGYLCTKARSEDAQGKLTCSPWCQADADCVASAACDRYTGRCGAAVEPSLGTTGVACDDDEECRSNLCGSIAGVSGGFCTSFCSVSRQGCPDGAHCVRQLEDDDDLGACYVPCTTSEECHGGSVCIEIQDGSGFSACGAPD